MNAQDRARFERELEDEQHRIEQLRYYDPAGVARCCEGGWSSTGSGFCTCGDGRRAELDDIEHNALYVLGLKRRALERRIETMQFDLRDLEIEEAALHVRRALLVKA